VKTVINVGEKRMWSGRQLLNV